MLKDIYYNKKNLFVGKISGSEAKEKFKTLKDIYRKIVKLEIKPSGSARKINKKWKNYYNMEFLKDLNTSQKFVKPIFLCLYIYI